MKLESPLNVTIDLNWRVLLLVVVAASILVFAFSTSAAPGGPPNANDPAAQPAAASAPTAPNPPVRPDGVASDALPTANGEWVSPASLASGPAPAGAQAEGATFGRHYYLTFANYHPNQALTACAAGYHLASLWELLDVSNLIYDYNLAAAHKKADSGYGPPSGWSGWVRTGFNSSGSSTAGQGNCQNWTSTAATDYGTIIRLSNSWETAASEISPWDATAFTCGGAGPVWCVRDVYQVYLPVIMRN